LIDSECATKVTVALGLLFLGTYDTFLVYVETVRLLAYAYLYAWLVVLLAVLYMWTVVVYTD